MNNAPKVIECLEKYYGRDFSESIGFNVLVAIVQELIYVRENNVKVTNDFYKYNNKETSLKLLTQNSNRVIPEIVKEAWIRRVENRVALNYGQQELMKVKRQIENKIFSIKAFVYSYRNYDDAKFVSDFLYRFIADIIFSSKSACNYGKEIFNKISAKISEKIKGYYVDVAMNSVNIMAYLKTMLLNKDILEEKIINEISFSVINSYKENSFIVYDSTYYFNIEKYNINEEYLLVYRINKIKRSLLFSKFRRIIKEEQLEKAVELGLEKFIEI